MSATPSRPSSQVTSPSTVKRTSQVEVKLQSPHFQLSSLFFAVQPFPVLGSGNRGRRQRANQISAFISSRHQLRTPAPISSPWQWTTSSISYSTALLTCQMRYLANVRIMLPFFLAIAPIVYKLICLPIYSGWYDPKTWWIRSFPHEYQRGRSGDLSFYAVMSVCGNFSTNDTLLYDPTYYDVTSARVPIESFSKSGGCECLYPSLKWSLPNNPRFCFACW